MKVWRDRRRRTRRSRVSLSNRDLQDPRLAERLTGLGAAVGLAPNALAVEIAETWIMANPETAIGNILRLQTLGIAVDIDSFGIGYSSLATIQGLAARELKIDRSFVAGLPGDVGGCPVARAVIALGRTLGLWVVADGIETQAQADLLRAEGCRIGQGHCFSRPLPAAQFETYVRDRIAGPPRAGG